MGLRGKLVFATLMFGAAAMTPVSAQQFDFDPKSLDASGAASAHKAKKPATKQNGAAAGADKSAKGDKPKADRQFGELEGWSPGKAPPKKKEDEASGGRFSGSAPVSVGPSGNLNVGLPF